MFAFLEKLPERLRPLQSYIRESRIFDIALCKQNVCPYRFRTDHFLRSGEIQRSPKSWPASQKLAPMLGHSQALATKAVRAEYWISMKCLPELTERYVFEYYLKEFNGEYHKWIDGFGW